MVISHLKLRVEELYTTVEELDGTIPIRLLKFLGTVAEESDSVVASVASSAPILNYYLETESKDVH